MLRILTKYIDKDTTLSSLEQWKEAHKDNKAYIDSILQVKAAGEEMGIN